MNILRLDLLLSQLDSSARPIHHSLWMVTKAQVAERKQLLLDCLLGLQPHKSLRKCPLNLRFDLSADLSINWSPSRSNKNVLTAGS